MQIRDIIKSRFYALDRGNLAFFAPKNSKYTFKFMHFGPINDPGLYTCKMQDFCI